jgi:hypothetical protein
VAAVGELVQSTTGQWMIRPPTHCPAGHLLRPGRMLVGSIACSCGRHLTWRCECGAVTYGPTIGDGCRLLNPSSAFQALPATEVCAAHDGDVAPIADSDL